MPDLNTIANLAQAVAVIVAAGPIVHSWRKLRPLVEDLRRQTGRATRWEWFQWLAERMMERETARPPVPAHVEHRAWTGAVSRPA